MCGRNTQAECSPSGAGRGFYPDLHLCPAPAQISIATGLPLAAVLLKALPHGDGSAGGMDGLTPVYGAFPPPRTQGLASLLTATEVCMLARACMVGAGCAIFSMQQGMLCDEGTHACAGTVMFLLGTLVSWPQTQNSCFFAEVGTPFACS